MNTTEMIKNCIETAYLEKSPQTARSYENGLRIFQKSLMNDGITAENFIEFPVFLMRQNLSKSSVGVYLAASHYLLDWMVVGGYLAPTYAETLRLKKAEQNIRRKRHKTLPKTPRRGDAEKLLNTIRDLPEKPIVRERNIAIFEFLASTGCRNNEIVHLNVGDLDMDDQSAVVIGKGDKERRVYFSNIAGSALRDYWEVRGYCDRDAPVFSRHDKSCGKRIEHITTSTVRNIVSSIVEKAGIGKNAFTPHSFRHAYATRMYQVTHDLALVQDLLGHANPSTTRIYAQIYPEDMKATYRQVFG